MLKKTGVAIMATKMYYFGVGGSLCEFEEYLENNYGNLLELESLQTVCDKRNNKREVVSIRWKGE